MAAAVVLGARAANGARRSRSGRKEGRVRTTWSSRERSRRVKARGRARRGRVAQHGFVVAARRRSSACAHGVAPRGDVAKLQGNTRGAERAGARRVDDGEATAFDGERRHCRNREGKWSEGKIVNKAKFKTLVCKFNFSPFSRGQTKNF